MYTETLMKKYHEIAELRQQKRFRTPRQPHKLANWQRATPELESQQILAG